MSSFPPRLVIGYFGGKNQLSCIQSGFKKLETWTCQAVSGWNPYCTRFNFFLVFLSFGFSYTFIIYILKPLPNQQMHLNGKGSFKAVVLRRWGVKMSTFLFIYYLVYLPHTNKLQWLINYNDCNDYKVTVIKVQEVEQKKWPENLGKTMELVKLRFSPREISDD